MQGQLQAALALLGVIPPPGLNELYTWYDGVDGAQAPEFLFGEQQFLSLDEALQEYQHIQNYYSSSLVNMAQCFPFAGFQGSIGVVYGDTTPIEGLHHPVLEIYHGISIAFENLDRMVETVNEWFRMGGYDTEPVDEILRLTIRQCLNPQLPAKASLL
ncbi:MAG: hypothetical protein AAGF95_02800 [Chloroflexota bacterium]